jgi:transcription antitermination factor NusG
MLPIPPIDPSKVYPPAQKPSLVVPGHREWYALLVAPQCEDSAKEWLSRRCGATSFYPVREEWRATPNRKAQRERRFVKYAPGYLFACFRGQPVWYRILDREVQPFIRDVIRLQTGEPGMLHPSTIKSLYAMRKRDEVAVERRRLARMVNVGDRVDVKAGPFTDFHDLEVVEIKGSAAKIKIMIFGYEREIEINVEALRKVGT